LERRERGVLDFARLWVRIEVPSEVIRETLCLPDEQQQKQLNESIVAGHALRPRHYGPAFTG